MRDIIINKTEREGLLYLLFQDLKYKFGKFLNLHNFILRKKRISNFLNQNDKINIQFGAGSGKFGEAKKTVLGTLQFSPFQQLDPDEELLHTIGVTLPDNLESRFY